MQLRRFTAFIDITLTALFTFKCPVIPTTRDCDILAKAGPVPYRIRETDNTIHRRHADQICTSNATAIRAMFLFCIWSRQSSLYLICSTFIKFLHGLYSLPYRNTLSFGYEYQSNANHMPALSSLCIRTHEYGANCAGLYYWLMVNCGQQVVFHGNVT